jgi:hypothetical protein
MKARVALGLVLAALLVAAGVVWLRGRGSSWQAEAAAAKASVALLSSSGQPAGHVYQVGRGELLIALNQPAPSGLLYQVWGKEGGELRALGQTSQALTVAAGQLRSVYVGLNRHVGTSRPDQLVGQATLPGAPGW